MYTIPLCIINNELFCQSRAVARRRRKLISNNFTSRLDARAWPPQRALLMAVRSDSPPTLDSTRLVVKVQYPSICSVFESDLDCLLDDLNTVSDSGVANLKRCSNTSVQRLPLKDISGYTCTLQAVCKDKCSQTLTRSVVNYVTGGPDAVYPYCKTYSGKNRVKSHEE